MNGPVAPSLGELPATSKPRLLLVEDEHSISVFLGDLLGGEYDVEFVTDGEAAWSATQRQLPDLMLADVGLPSLNGIDLTRRLRADGRTASLPIILITANNRKETLLQGLEAGMDDFLLKPFHPLELLARLRCQRRLITLRRVETEQIARRTAEAVEQTRNRFLACLSHELRTPLTPIHMAAHVISQKKGLPEFVYEGLDMIRRNVEIEARLINDLLDISRIVEGQLELNLGPTDLHECLGQALSDSREDLAAKHLKVNIDLSAARYEVTGDAARLRQVFWNLLSNAAKFTPEGGHVTVRSGNDGDDIVVEVQDSGQGIDAEALLGIFQPLKPVDSMREQLHGGLGIGLAIAQAIVTAHQGQLTAQSPGVGQGATLRLCLHVRKVPNSFGEFGTTDR